jgi:hypothetical protein
MIDEKFKILLEQNWTPEEEDLIKKIMSGVKYYTKILPKNLKKDIADALDLCNKLKTELESFKQIP